MINRIQFAIDVATLFIRKIFAIAKNAIVMVYVANA